jgi:GNAT superfamily N-acetyltransferase
MTIEIKILTLEDMGALHIAEDLFDHPVLPQRCKDFLADPRHHWIAAIDANIMIGFVSAVDYLHPDKAESELWINEVGVSPSHQGRGIGKELIQATIQHGRRLGCREAWVLTHRENVPAMNLYAGSGGVETSPDCVMFNFDLQTD